MGSEVEYSRKSVMALTRKKIYLSLLVCLLAPLLLVSTFGALGAKGIFPLTFLAGIMGGGGGLFLLQVWEKKMQRSVTQLVQARIERLQSHSPDLFSPSSNYEQEIERLKDEFEKMRTGYEHQISLMHASVAKSKDEVYQLHLNMDKKLEEMRQAYLEFEDLRQEYRKLEEESKNQLAEAQKNLEHREGLIAEYQKTIAEQRMIIEKKHRYINKLEAKVKDQMYEIRSLLQIETPLKENGIESRWNIPEPELPLPLIHGPQTAYDFSIQLHRYIEKAEHLVGVDHLGYVGGKSPRFLDLSLEGYAVDKRRLFDVFKDEMGCAVFIYALAEKKFLFVNSAVKTLTGWSQEKFMKEFSRLTVKGYPDWEEGLNKIKGTKECSLKLSILNRNNEPSHFDCYMGLIAKGPFAQHVVGILGSERSQ